jgi:NADH:ubiquinone oxidoreductase subunit E
MELQGLDRQNLDTQGFDPQGLDKDDLNEAVAECLADLPGRFSPGRESLMPVLQFVQGRVGYLSPESMRGIARFLKVPEAVVYGAATFYAQFRFEPSGKYRITVCQGTACHVRGSSAILRDLEMKLGLEAGGTTDDLNYTLETVACLGACAMGPVMVLNDEYQSRMTKRKTDEVLRICRCELEDALSSVDLECGGEEDSAG